MRTKIFSWTDASLPFETRRGSQLNIMYPQVITVIGKPFYDVDHSGKDTQNNRRNYDQNIAVWEIHPVMKLVVVGSEAETRESQQVNRQASATSSPSQFVTLIKPITLKIPYGQTVLRPGTRLR
jgi:hypothetical protein